MARIGDPLYLSKLTELLQVRDPFDLPEIIDPRHIGVTIAIPAQLLLQRAQPLPVAIVAPDSGESRTYATRVKLTRAAPGAGVFAWLAVAVAPISTTRKLRRLDLVGFRIFPHVTGQEPGFTFVKLDGHLGAAPAAPNDTMRRLYQQNVSQLTIDSEHVARTSNVGFGADDEVTNSFAVTERLLEWRHATAETVIWPEGRSIVGHTPHALSRAVDPNQPHLCGFIIGVAARIANTALAADFEIVVRETVG